MSALFAFLHHLAFVGLMAVLALEMVLVRDELNLERARKLMRFDLAYGVLAGVILIVGFLRVIYFEKGWDYYQHSIPFLIKMSLFLVVGLLSIIPTVEFLSWRKLIATGQVPVLNADKKRRLSAIIHVELLGLSLMLLCAALMARGMGQMT
ncbi:MAG: DUF2214 family protein [Burkholderiaceae bacterium]|nr:MAG: DUF2214 family protein [Burkholderiaceae bacterium]